MKKANWYFIFFGFLLLIFSVMLIVRERNQWQEAGETAVATVSAAATREAALTEQLMTVQETAVAQQLTLTELRVASAAIAATREAQFVEAERTVANALSQQTALAESLATEQQLNAAQTAALNSSLLLNSSPQLIDLSTLLAIEALQRQNNPATRLALQESLSVLLELVTEMERPHRDAYRLIWGNDGRFVISQSWEGVRASNYRFWHAENGLSVEQIPVLLLDDVTAWSEDGRYLVEDNWPNGPSVFDTVANTTILTLPAPTFGYEVSFSADNSLMAYSTGIKSEESSEHTFIFALYDLSAGEEIMVKVIEPARERTVASYEAMAFSGDGRYVVGASNLRMDIWDLAAQQIVAQLPLHVSFPETVLFSPDNTYIAVSGFNGTQVWNLAEGVELPLNNSLSGNLQTVRFSADSQYLVVTRQDRREVGEDGAGYVGHNGTQVWEMSTGAEILRLPESNTDASFIEDTHHLLTINQADAIQIWDVDTREMLGQSQLNTQKGVAINPTGETIAGVDESGNIRVWSTAPFLTTQTITPMTLRENYRSLDNLNLITYSPDGATLATASWDGIVRLWASETGQEQSAIAIEGVIRDLVFNSDGTRLIIGGGNYPSPAPDWQGFGYTFIQEIATGQTITLTHDVHVRDVVFAPNGRTFATASNITQLWHADTGEAIWTCAPDTEPMQLLFSPEGDRLILLAEKTIVVCDVNTGQILKQIPLPVNAQFRQMALHPDGRLLATAETNTIKVWNLETEEVVVSFPVDSGKLAFSPDGRYLGALPLKSATTNKLLTVWETANWEPVFQSPLRSLADFAFSPDSNYLAFANDKG
ncbi:MAG: hypothetical protein KC445_18870, partial [Anaerolineales bacterium]|nr:hypothetical protein [Anaerolineales bacterium]